MRELIINKEKQIETVCLIENGKLIEKYQNDESSKENRLEGNIYKGKVEDIVPGMQAAFVNYGYEKNGLLHLKDALPQIDERNEKALDLSNKKVSDYLKLNQDILIQIKKDSNDKKGAKISTHISIPSKHIVFMPNTKIITISKKISDEKRKEELIKLVRDNISENNGAVIRTSAETAKNDEIVQDLKNCLDKWNQILNDYSKSKKEGLIYQSESVQEKILLDIKIDKVITNDKQEFDKLKKLFEYESLKNVKLEYSPKDNLLKLYDIADQLNKTKKRKIWLNCGGFITIDRTEALTAIDVNTGKFTGTKDLETTVFKVNTEATMEIARQLRLQDIGGIIIIDYIDMHIEENKKKIQELLQEQLLKDRAKTQIEGFTKLNLMELTRKHICSHLDV